ncbi:unnamed protein product [Didymodactylos carnosus]|uniref:Proteasome activator complex subunit 4 n=1 Tax=Didymodactylos carnosus TaxID=1234261 RepID=A0A8S2GIE4_9BILA|nr:unnamed protein product [Didymodactylos carnosus]CAF3512930.1 unnamed protein product [Didymodactylos carnosus]
MFSLVEKRIVAKLGQFASMFTDIKDEQMVESDSSADEDEQKKLQKPNIFNKYLPYYENIKKQGFDSFNEICENLSRIIQLRELRPGFSHWSSKLQRFISLYGYYFTKEEHLRLVDFYLSILSIKDLDYSHVKTCFDMLYDLMRKTRLITRDDLTVDWKQLYHWAKLILHNHDEPYALVAMPHDIENSLYYCVRGCRPYFSATSTQEMLDEFRPYLCPFDSAFSDAMRVFELFLPVHLPPQLHDNGFKLWLHEFLGIWESVYSNPVWEANLVNLFSLLAWCNIGSIDWEPWLPKIFTRVLKSLSLPVGSTNINVSLTQYNYSMTSVTTWIVAMLGNGSSCLQYLKDLFTAIKTFYHPSNTGKFQQDLVGFLSKLAQAFVDRVHLERKAHPIWFFTPLQTHRLTEQDITDFVNCVKEAAFIAIFTKSHQKEASKACQYLSMLRPELIIPPIVEKLFSSVESMTEPHRFTSIMNCLAGVARQIVRQTPHYTEGQTYVIPLLMAVLPGIDPNDFKKTAVTFQFLNAILMLVTCVDCSSAIHTRTDLTPIEKEVCLSTAKFEDFIVEFLNRTFQMIDTLSTEMSEAVTVVMKVNMEDHITELALTSMMFGIVQQCSQKIFQLVLNKITNFIAGSFYTPKVGKMVTGLVRAILKGNPTETLKHFLSQTCERITKIMNNSETTILTDHKGDTELTWCLILFSELLRAKGDTLIQYKQMIMQVFHRCIHIIHKDSYEALANAAKNLLKSLTYVYPIDYRLTVENIDEPFTEFLPIRAWGQHVEFDNLQVQFHIPNEDEVDFACEFVKTYLYPELNLLTEKGVKLSNDERLRSLTIVHYISMGCLRMVPRIDSNEVEDLVPSVAPYGSKFSVQYSIYAKQPQFDENLRLRLLTDIGKLIDVLVENNSDDASSLKTALKIFSLASIYYGVFKHDADKLWKHFENAKHSFMNKLYGERQYPRFLMIERITLQSEQWSLSNFQTLTEIDKKIVLKLFELSINRYGEVRRDAQGYLFSVLNRYLFSYQVILERILTLLSSTEEIDHDIIKGCLYVLLGNHSFFMPTKHSWSMIEKLWPALARVTVKKPTAQRLIDHINETIGKQFDTQSLIEDTNDESIKAAEKIWRPLTGKELEQRNEIRQKRNDDNVKAYTNLMENLNSLLTGDQLTWRQQEMTMSFMWLLLQRRVPLPLPCIKTFVDLLVHDNVELRKIAEEGVAAFCRLQKPARTFIEKPIEAITHIKPNGIHPGDRDDNLWVTYNNYEPKNQQEWENTCFLDKSFWGYYSWPKSIKYSLNQRERYNKTNLPEHVAIIYERFSDKNFIEQFAQFMILDEEKGKVNFDTRRFQMFKGIFRNFGLEFVDNFLECLYTLIHNKDKTKQEGSHRVAAEITAGMIRGSKYWTVDMLDELWKKLTPFLDEMLANLSPEALAHWGSCFKLGIEDEDPRRMYKPIGYIRSLTSGQTSTNTFNETARWYLTQTIANFEWRVPTMWTTINEHAKELLDHPFKAVRERIANVLAMSLSFDIELPNGQSIRHPDVNKFIDSMRERLRQAIEIYEKTPLGKCLQPVKGAIVRIFPLLCEVESIVANDEVVRKNLAVSRLCIAMTYLQEPYMETLISELEQVCASSKYHARRSAIQFVQNMVFSNLFNVRIYDKRLRTIVLKCLFDDQFEVRTVASVTLSGFYQCGYMLVSSEDLKHFKVMSKTNYFTKVDGKKVTSTENIVKRHGGVLGLCAIVLSSPYEIPSYLPEALMLLAEHSHDPDLIQKSIKKTLSEFRRTHHDQWHEHREKFTEDQLVILADVLISPNYYA